MVTLRCGGATVPGGFDHATLTLSEGDYTSEPQSIPLVCPQTSHQVTISRYTKGRMLVATVAVGSGEHSRTVISGQTVTLDESCSVLDVDLTKLAPSDGGNDSATADAASVEASDTIDTSVDDAPGPHADGALLGNGAPCAQDGECSTGNCAGGVCCSERCDGDCQKCEAGSGVCLNLPKGSVSPACTSMPNAASCGQTGTCDDSGRCALFDATTMCKAAGCDVSSLTVIAAGFCTGQGNCVTGSNSDCGAYRCSAGACNQTCTTASDCNGVPCVGGQCGGKHSVGATCNSNAECDKGFCIDGVCCENACSGSCMACAHSLTGRNDGSCGPALSGTDPRNKCDAESGCGQDGTCDGNGACRKHGSDTSCTPAFCDGNHKFTKGGTCDGSGTCSAGAVVDCGLYRCNANGCGQAPCASDNDCAADIAVCDSGHHCSGKVVVTDAGTGDGAGSDSGGSNGDPRCNVSGLIWKTGNKTNFVSYPDPNSVACLQFHACDYEGQFSQCPQQTETMAWVMSHNIVAAFPLANLSLHDLCLKSGNKSIVVTVIDTCADSDCSGCCTQNKGATDLLVDVESFTNVRWGVADGPIQWADLGATMGSGCN
jgi:hypothetical protein